MRKRTCIECGEVFTSPKPHAEFCCQPCRKEFNNRRAMRGAQIYDLFMTMRFDRKTAADKHVWSTLCSVASAFRDSDRLSRSGRRSWRKINAALEAIPIAYGSAGDGR